MVEKHGDERRSSIDPMPLSMDREDLTRAAIVISLSEDNYIRHMPVEFSDFRIEGGRDSNATTKDEDFSKINTYLLQQDVSLIFTNCEG